MCAKLSDLSAFAERMGAKTAENLPITFTPEEKTFILKQIDEELRRNKAVLKGKCSKDVRPKTRVKFDNQRVFLQNLRKKLC